MTERAVANRVRSALVLGVLLLLSSRAAAVDVKLWPLIDYHHDTSGHLTLHLLGPLFAYASGPDGVELALRPLLSYTRSARSGQHQFAFLYPVFVSRWDEAQTEHRLFALLSYQTETARRPDEWDKRFTIFPFVFYRYSLSRGTSLSVLPFYADVHDFFGYARVQMIAFPLYLHLEESLVQRTWLPFPFVSWSGGILGRGYRVFPFYGWEQNGESERFTYVLWPFYVSHERHFTRPERERRLVVFPFYASIDSPTLQSRSYGTFFTHTVDRTAQTETRGFPWPLWLSQRDLRSGARTGLRLAPFYEDTYFGNLHAHFVMWPLYRWSTQEVDGYRHTRRDALLVLYRDIEDVQPAYDHRRRLRTLFPLYRSYEEDDQREFSTLALLDALLPRNPTIRLQYAPLWQVYTHQQDGELPARWSLLWDLISSDGSQMRYPVHIDVSH